MVELFMLYMYIQVSYSSTILYCTGSTTSGWTGTTPPVFNNAGGGSWQNGGPSTGGFSGGMGMGMSGMGMGMGGMGMMPNMANMGNDHGIAPSGTMGGGERIT